jgi:MOSC domain-containing protein YiiM
MKTYGHVDCGVYAEVIGAGEIAVGDAVTTGG